MRRKSAAAGMTIFFALAMTVMTALICASILSVKVSFGRMQAANAVDQALFSLFARYDRQLEEKYDLFFIDAGCGGPPDIAAVCSEIEDAASYILDPGKGNLVPMGKPLLTLTIEQCVLDSYSLATDANGALFAAQAVQAVENTAALESISFLRDRVSGGEAAGELGREAVKEAESASYSSIMKQSGQAKREREEAIAAGDESAEALPEVPPGFRNPLPVLERLKRLSVMRIVVPPERTVSDGKADLGSFVSRRKTARGIGVIDTTKGTLRGAGGLAFKAYVRGHYSTYMSPSPNSALAYQTEYILYGKKSDEKNLKAVVGRLIALREAANIACIYTDPKMSSELSETALLIGLVLLIPEAEPLIKLLLAAGWAYAESLIDVRALLEGKRIPYVKTANGWQADLMNLAMNGGDISGLSKDAPGGMDYTDYLGVLLLAASPSKIVKRAMDMTESEIRGSGRPDFRLDSCIGAVGAKVSVRSENRVTFPVGEKMDYRDM